jgi:hypothetical protein
MALCTRCGRQAEDGAEFCSSCGGYPGPAFANRPLAGPAMTAAAGYLRPFAAEQTAAPELPGPASEPAFLADQQHWPDPAEEWPVPSPSGLPPDFTPPPGQAPSAGYPPGAGQPFGPATDGYFAAASESAAGAPGSWPHGESVTPGSWPHTESVTPDSQPPRPQAGHDMPPDSQPPRPPPDGQPHFGPTASPAFAAQARWVPTQREPYNTGPGQDDGTWHPGSYPALGWPAQQEAAARNELDGPPLAPPDDDEWGPDQSWLAASRDEALGRKLRRRDRTPPPIDHEPGTHQPARTHNARWVSIAATAVVLIMAAAIVTILLAGHGKPASTAGAGKPASGRSPKPSSPATTPSVTGSGLISVTPGAAAAPDAPAVENFLTRYFTAINDHSYPAYQRLFSAAIRGGLSAAAFQTGYGSSRDSRATLRSITALGGGQLAAAVTFISRQQPADSPTHSACTAWSITLYLVRQHGGLVIEPPPAGYSATSSTCS